MAGWAFDRIENLENRIKSLQDERIIGITGGCYISRYILAAPNPPLCHSVQAGP